jgi:hypothetical protein
LAELGRWSLLGFRKGYLTALLWVGDALDPVAAKFLSDQKTLSLKRSMEQARCRTFRTLLSLGRNLCEKEQDKTSVVSVQLGFTNNIVM